MARSAAAILLLVGAALALMAPVPAAAYEESDAPLVDPRVAAVWHEPERVPAHTHWSGFIELVDGQDVGAAFYQVCLASQCFAPPTAADRISENTFAFNTTDYQVSGRAIDYEPGWRLGVKWCLQTIDGNGTSGANGTCEWIPPQTGSVTEAHYFWLSVAGHDKDSPQLGLAAVILAAFALAAARRT